MIFQIEKEAENTPNSGKVEWFLQGTLYPDVLVDFGVNCRISTNRILVSNL